MWSYRIFAWARVPLLSVMRCRGAMSRVCRSWCRSAVLPAQSVNAVPIYKNTSILNRNLGNWKFYIRNMSRKGRKNIRRFQNISHSVHTLTRKTGLGQLFKKNTQTMSKFSNFQKVGLGSQTLFLIIHCFLANVISSIPASHSLQLLLNPTGPCCLYRSFFVQTLPFLDGTLAGDCQGTVTSCPREAPEK